jgi:hypothetical protein
LHISCFIGKHKIPDWVEEELKKEKYPSSYIFKCSEDKCDNYIKLIKINNNNEYLKMDVGKEIKKSK